ncbi:MAG TPA: SGNH/GDSL hydrolase family protein [Candidatus Hydrogenedentes bacterium]|nr:SGNH/GDSL hydrolase family protein [Candidatus Hydrogenedentota bacterium]
MRYLRLLAQCAALIVLAMMSGCATTTKLAESAVPSPLAAEKGIPSADGTITWFDGLDIGTEGQGWDEGLDKPYDRFPASAEGKVPDPVWGLSRHSAGINIRFVTDSPSISVRWSLRNGSLALTHMPATGVSGVDLYVKHEGRWGWLATGFPEKEKDNESLLVSKVPEGKHEYRIYLPLYNGTERIEIGVKTGSFLAAGPAYPDDRAKPMLFWGSSILQGACASRTGMAYPSIIGRQLERPVINLGFSGNGLMDPPIVEMIAQLDVSVYVIDCCPNMTPELVTERTEPLVRTLRAARPDTPIVLVENVPYEQGWFLPASKSNYEGKNKALRAAFDRLRAAGVRDLHYIPCDGMFGDDTEATVDGVHPNDLGFARMAEVIGKPLARILR